MKCAGYLGPEGRSSVQMPSAALRLAGAMLTLEG